MIRTLIVMTTYGQIFFSKETFFGSEASETDISLTAGLISAIYNMTTETQQQKITELELENDRSVFRELPGEKLFIITVDKRMDTDDADDLLDELAQSFVEKYGDMVVDGMILNDFEPVVDEVVSERIWYNTVVQNLRINDIIPMLAILLSGIWYPFWLFNGQETVIVPLKTALDEGLTTFLIEALIIGLQTFGPLILSVILLQWSPNLKQTFRYSFEYIRRPTRGGYAELLPGWFLFFPLFMSLTFISLAFNAGGTQYALAIQLWNEPIKARVVNELGQPILFYYIYAFIILFLLTWYILLPVMVGAITGELSWKWMKSTCVIISYAFIVYLPAHIFAGVIYHDILGFQPNNVAAFNEASGTLEYIFLIRTPVFLFQLLFIYYLGVGLFQLVTKNKERYPLGIGIGFFLILSIQELLFYVIFKSGLFVPSGIF